MIAFEVFFNYFESQIPHFCINELTNPWHKFIIFQKHCKDSKNFLSKIWKIFSNLSHKISEDISVVFEADH